MLNLQTDPIEFHIPDRDYEPREQTPPNYTLHHDTRNGSILRDRIFGHHDSIISFSEGFLAKILGSGELQFYQSYLSKLHLCLPPELIPQVVGICYFPNGLQNRHKDAVSFMFQPIYNLDAKQQQTVHQPYLLQRDITAGYKKPAILDIKIGIRTWKLGDSKEIEERRSKKLKASLCSMSNFRVRAAMWYHDVIYENPHYENEDGLTIVTREFGNSCNLNELLSFFKDFFKFPGVIPAFVEKLKTLKKSLIKLRNIYGLRLYSSSILIVYDDENPDLFDLRILDFEKSYLDIEKVAEQYNETLESAEDGVIDAVDNLQKLLETVKSEIEGSHPSDHV